MSGFLRAAAALVSGAVFGLGLATSGMMDPVRVRGFLDIFGAFDPTLVFVIAGAVAVAFVGVSFAKRMARPVLDHRFSMPTADRIDRKLIVGSALFGVGWGMAGLCPGPALAGLTLGLVPVVVFVAAMIVGMLLHDRLVAGRAR
jgi:uncharacterized membrane protein YedE/YeeE